jgi:hypothetical protein
LKARAKSWRGKRTTGKIAVAILPVGGEACGCC